MIVTGLDFETTGFLEPEHRIIEICASLYDLDAQRKLGSWVQRVNPSRPIEPKAQEKHGISFEDVAHCPLFEDVADKMVRVLAKSDLIVAHNGVGFDGPFVAQELRRVGRAVPPMRMIDTMLQGTWAVPFGKPSGMPKLGELCFACRVPYDEAKAHSAEYDVDVMMQAFFHARQKGFFTEYVTL